MAENTLCRNAALPYPVYGVPWAMIVPLLDADGDPVTSAADLDAEISKNGDTAADIGGTESEVGGGNYLLTFTAADMTANAIGGTLKTSTSGAKATQFALQPRRLPVVASGTAQGGAAGYVTLAAGTAQFDGQFTGCLLVVDIDGTKQARICTGSTASNQQCAVGDEFTTVPDSDDTYEVMVPDGVAYQASDVRAIAGNATNATNLGTAASNYSATRGLAGTALPAAAADAAGGLPISDAGGLDLDTLLARLDAAITTRHASGAAVAKSPATLDWSADVSNKPTIGTSTLTAQQVWEYATRILTANTNLGLPASWPATWPANWSWSTLDAAGVRAAVGLASANLDTQLSGISGYVDVLPATWVTPPAATDWTPTRAGYLDAAVSTRSAHSAADVWTNGTRTLSAFAFTVAATVSDKTGFSLSATGLDAIADPDDLTPATVPSTFTQKLRWLIQRFWKADKSATTITVKNEAGQAITSQAITSLNDDETVGKPT